MSLTAPIESDLKVPASCDLRAPRHWRSAVAKGRATSRHLAAAGSGLRNRNRFATLCSSHQSESAMHCPVAPTTLRLWQNYVCLRLTVAEAAIVVVFC